MNEQASEFLVATRAAIAQAGALLVQYSFSVLGAIVLLILGWLVSRLLHRWALAGMMRIRHFDVTLAHFLANVLRYAVIVLVFVTALGQFGVQTASIIAALGAAGLAIGLALQGTLQNIAAGIMLLVLRPFRVGEAIETSNVSGTVQEIGLFATELKTFDGLFLLAPNSLLWNTPIKNFSRLELRRFDATIVLPIGSDTRQAQAALYALAEDDSRVKADPAPIVVVAEQTSYSVKLTLMVWFTSSDFGAASRDLQMAAKTMADTLRSRTSGAATQEAAPIADELLEGRI